MADGIDIGGGWRGHDMARAVTRIAATVRQDARREPPIQPANPVQPTPAEAARPASPRPADAAAIDAARDSIATTLSLTGTATAIPIAPGASEDAVAAAQALAQLIAANARPALVGQARLDAHTVVAAIEPPARW